MNNSKKHLFIIGNPRSGTSLLRIMLNSHSKMTIPPECGFIQWWYEKHKFWSKESNINKFVFDLKTSKKIETWNLNYKSLEDFLKKDVPLNYEELVFKVIEFYGQSKLIKVDQLVLGDKNNYYINHLQELNKICPHAFFIFLIRDPKSVFSSYKGIKSIKTDSNYKPKLSTDLDGFIKEWISNHKQILDFTRILRMENYIIINYETLVVNTQKELIKISNFLDLHFEPEMLNYYKTNDEPSGLLDWKQKTLQPPDPSSINLYKEKLTKEEMHNIQKQTASLYNFLLDRSITSNKFNN